MSINSNSKDNNLFGEAIQQGSWDALTKLYLQTNFWYNEEKRNEKSKHDLDRKTDKFKLCKCSIVSAFPVTVFVSQKFWGAVEQIYHSSTKCTTHQRNVGCRHTKKFSVPPHFEQIYHSSKRNEKIRTKNERGTEI
ncbi:uncharacterized protein LOC118738706 isoform X1 [Rhagoletis pomonella]|uniref:uncharacterized protein LOC118738706 isoform X1 n=1 Tax=Rhagoletis pomonella TaxID=28610 RepID=UPI00178753BB|nr:uncharacterized protein LOC118738706 isoform X1 [Rhagoletis pomonella]